MICGDTPTYGWLGGLMGGLMSNYSNQINLDLIEIIQLWTFWTILDILLKPPKPLMGLFLEYENIKPCQFRYLQRAGI